MLVSHIDNDHCGDWIRSQKSIDTNKQYRKVHQIPNVEQEEFVSSVLKITPDIDFLTKNTLKNTTAHTPHTHTIMA